MTKSNEFKHMEEAILYLLVNNELWFIYYKVKETGLLNSMIFIILKYYVIFII